MPLSAPDVNLWAVELSTKRLMAEWLKQWFNGAPHVVPGAANPVTFPRVDIGFDQGPPPQPLEASTGCGIRVVMHPGNSDEYADVDGWVNFQAVQFHFWVRAAIRPNAAGGTSQKLAANVAALLFGLLHHPVSALDLARKGVAHLRPQPSRRGADDRIRLPASGVHRVAGLHGHRGLTRQSGLAPAIHPPRPSVSLAGANCGEPVPRQPSAQGAAGVNSSV